MRKKKVLFRPMPILSDRDLQRFDKLINKKGDCWEWLGKIEVGGGYGVFCVKLDTFKAHRVSLFLHTKLDPKEMFVCHKCDNRSCVNPNHLFLGTNADNMKDALLKGRMFLGEKNHQSKLTMKDVIKIRKLYKDGNMSQSEISKMFPVSSKAINLIVNNKRWAI